MSAFSTYRFLFLFLSVVLLGNESLSAQKHLQIAKNDTLKVRWEAVDVNGIPDTIAQLNLFKIKTAKISVYQDSSFSQLLYETDVTKGSDTRNETYYYPNGRIKKSVEIKMIWLIIDTTEIQRNAAGDTVYVTREFEKSRPCGKYEVWHPNGLLKVSGQLHFIPGQACKPTGIWSYHSREGLPLEEVTYNAIGIKHGSYKSYFPNGKLRLEGNYINGKKGTFKVYDYEGNLIREKSY